MRGWPAARRGLRTAAIDASEQRNTDREMQAPGLSVVVLSLGHVYAYRSGNRIPADTDADSGLEVGIVPVVESIAYVDERRN